MKGQFEKTHGKSYSRVYKSYWAMLQRCTNPKDPSYGTYGGAGIAVCDRWLESFENFYADMGDRPPHRSLDRINGRLGYEPGNCRWATALEQNQNRDSTVPIEVAGIKYPSLVSACAAFGIATSTYHNRIKRGWTPDRALTQGIANNCGQAIEVAGVRYPTVTSMLRAYCITKKRYYEALKSGMTPEQALGAK